MVNKNKVQGINYLKFNRTKIVATIGPATSKYNVLKKIINAGVDVCRINFSHGEHLSHLQVINNIKKINDDLETNVCILCDLQGPKLRVGEIEGGSVYLKKGENIVLTTQKTLGNNSIIQVSYDKLTKDVKIGEKVLLDDGKIELKILEIVDDYSLKAIILNSGTLLSRKGFNLPDSKLSLKGLTDKDESDLKFALENDIDWIAMSFVRNANDIADLRKLVNKTNPRTQIIAKIEKPEAVKNFDSILANADGIMVARGDLGVEMAMQKVPLIQKQIVEKCLIASKPVIIATQMMESMIENPTPTRAEVNDIANAVLDGADAVMLSAETSIGKFPLKTVQTVEKIINEIESNSNPYYKGSKPQKTSPTFISDEICFTAVRMSEHLNARGIVGMTHSGYTAKKISSFRPNCDIFILTSNRPVLKTLNLVWGVRGFYYDHEESTDKTISDALNFLKTKKYVKNGDIVISCSSMPLSLKQRTNTIKVSQVE
ncbi:MAG: pyruvate kinase [Bacteroidetes bacterium]|nr:pyruvate kinase [Bacteroidota bacterium]